MCCVVQTVGTPIHGHLEMQAHILNFDIHYMESIVTAVLDTYAKCTMCVCVSVVCRLLW